MQPVSGSSKPENSQPTFFEGVKGCLKAWGIRFKNCFGGGDKGVAQDVFNLYLNKVCSNKMSGMEWIVCLSHLKKNQVAEILKAIKSPNDTKEIPSARSQIITDICIACFKPITTLEDKWIKEERVPKAPPVVRKPSANPPNSAVPVSTVPATVDKDPPPVVVPTNEPPKPSLPATVQKTPPPVRVAKGTTSAQKREALPVSVPVSRGVQKFLLKPPLELTSQESRAVTEIPTPQQRLQPSGKKFEVTENMRKIEIIINYNASEEIADLKTLLNCSSDHSIPHFEGMKKVAEEIISHPQPRNAKQFFNEFSIMQQLWILEQMPQGEEKAKEFKQQLINNYTEKLQSNKAAETSEARVFYAYVQKFQDTQPLYKSLLG
jgi:hypothetical protein